MAKPFDLSVLTAKVQAVLRRTYDLAGKVPVLEHRGAILNLYDTSLTYDGQKISLTKNEFRILQTLMENKGRLVSRDTLITKLWETDNYIEENTLTVNIARLRRKLEHAGLKDFITTKVGEGYLLENVTAAGGTESSARGKRRREMKLFAQYLYSRRHVFFLRSSLRGCLWGYLFSVWHRHAGGLVSASDLSVFCGGFL